MEQAETAGRQTQLLRLLGQIRWYGREMILKGTTLKRPWVSGHPRQCTVMRAGQVNKAAVAGINRIQTNHYRQVVTELIKVDECVATLKMLVVMKGNPRMGCSRLAGEKIGSPELIAGPKQINDQTGDGTIGDDLLGQRKPGVKVAGVLIRCGSFEFTTICVP